MRPLWFSLAVGSAVFACTIRTEVTGAPGGTSEEAGTDGGSLAPPADVSATADAAAALDAPAMRDASSAAPEDGSAEVAASCLVLAADYDQTCTADTDCINVGEVLTCPANECSFCRMETISTRAAPPYMAAFSRATAAIPADADECSCPEEGRSCCIAGTCQQCFPLAPLKPPRTRSGSR